MKINIKNTFLAVLLVPLLAFAASLVLSPADTFAACNDNLRLQNGVNCAQGDEQPEDLFGAGGIFSTITNVLLFLIGAISVIMLIIGGIRYTLSGGDQTAVTAAKNTILYAVIGIIVALLAFAIVRFVVTSFDS